MTRRRHARGGRGQALAELAIFGGIMLIALAGLVRIGLRYNYGQQASQEAFRRALKSAHDNQPSGRGSAQVFHDRYIPDPSRPFAIGQSTLFSGGASISWGNRMQVHQVDLESEIPQQEIRINADSRSHADPPDFDEDENEAIQEGGSRFYSTGRFMAWRATPPRQFRRLARVFCDSDADSDEEYEQCAEQLRRDRRKITGGIITLNRRHNFLDVPVVGQAGVTTPGKVPTIIVMDGCAGQVYEPELCRRQCLKLKCGPRANTPDEINQCLNAGTEVLPMPGYCPALIDPDTFERRKDERHGLDSTDYVRTLRFNTTVTGTPGRQDLTVTQNETIDGDAGRGIAGRVIRSQNTETYAPATESVPYDDNGKRNRSKTWTTP